MGNGFLVFSTLSDKHRIPLCSVAARYPCVSPPPPPPYCSSIQASTGYADSPCLRMSIPTNFELKFRQDARWNGK